ncbi:MAG: hypothetical protein QOJ32_3043 [Frankiaceae bacterium]|nr:hypothetical protein [Frankiaceae bacterium]MDQ1636234.1 hypothetical protein [Frankiaceae bacterium]
MSAGRTGGAGNAPQEPWHVPKVTPDALEQDLPSAVAEAAKRAFSARRPGSSLAELAYEGPGDTDDVTVYRFVCGGVTVYLSVCARETGLRLHVRCTGFHVRELEVLHGGVTVNENLNGSGFAEVDIEPGLLSVVVTPDRADVAPVQTMWIRIP